MSKETSGTSSENSWHSAAAAAIKQTWKDASATLENSGHAAAVVDSS
jgi:hypothetical protein